MKTLLTPITHSLLRHEIRQVEAAAELPSVPRHHLLATAFLYRPNCDGWEADVKTKEGYGVMG